MSGIIIDTGSTQNDLNEDVDEKVYCTYELVFFSSSKGRESDHVSVLYSANIIRLYYGSGDFLSSGHTKLNKTVSTCSKTLS